jgi:poly-gamma-glutamate capsule biosynthesis protein CapA/YwtB (metallophosphatase superfamily)
LEAKCVSSDAQIDVHDAIEPEGRDAAVRPRDNRRLHLIALGQALIEQDLREHPYPELSLVSERLRGADAVFSDLETTLRLEGAGVPTREGVFFHSAPPSVLDCLRELSINLLALSNNHSYDLGAAGIAATIEQTRARNFGHAGTGPNIHLASAPGYLESSAGSVALVAFASKVPAGSLADENRAGVNHLCLAAPGVLDDADRERILASVETAAQRSEVVVVYHHDHYWEPDWHDTPRWKQRWARACIEAGASAYISHGVPLLHGIEIYRGRPIFYGLGNFIFHTRTKVGHYEPAVWESVIAHCKFCDGRLEALRIEPIALNEMGEEGPDFLATRGRPSLAQAAHARSILERLRVLSAPYGTRMVIETGVGDIELS